MQKKIFSFFVILLTMSYLSLPVKAQAEGNEPQDEPQVEARQEKQLNSGEELIPQDGDNGIFIVDGTIKLYDEGGKDAAIGKDSLHSVLTFKPKTEGHVLIIKKISFNVGYTRETSFSLYSTENIDDTLANPIQVGINGSGTNFPAKLISEPNGAITIVWKHNKLGFPSAGFEVEIESREAKDKDVASCSVMPYKADAVYKSSFNTAMRIALDILGENGTAKISAFDFSTEGTTAPIKNIRFCYSAKDSAFSLSEAGIETLSYMASLPSNGNIQISSPNLEFAEEGKYNFFLCYEVDAAASAGDVVKIALSSYTSNGVQHNVEAENVYQTSVKSGVSGIILVGSSASAQFAKITEAIEHIKTSGIEGATEIQIEDGEYNEKLILKDIPGLSETNTLTITSFSGNKDGVHITNNVYNATHSGIINLDAVSYVNIKNITIDVPQDNSYNSRQAIYGFNGASNIKIDNCVITGKLNVETYANRELNQIKFYNSSSAKQYPQTNNIEVSNCEISGGQTAIYIVGFGLLDKPLMNGVKVTNNNISNFGSQAIYVGTATDVEISGNRIENSTVTKNFNSALNLNKIGGDVYNNIINISAPQYTTVMWLRGPIAHKNRASRVYNNSINVTNAPASTYGIKIVDGTGGPAIPVNVEIAYNTVRLHNDLYRKNYCIQIGKSLTSNDKVEIYNNIFQNECQGVVLAEEASIEGVESLPCEVKFSKNSFYSNAQNDSVFGYGSSQLCRFEDWNAIRKAENSVFAAAKFISQNNLSLKSSTDFNYPKDCDWIIYDILNNYRFATRESAVIGAYEFDADMSRTPEVDYLQISHVGSRTADIDLRFNKSGYLYYRVDEITEEHEAPNAENFFADAAVDTLEISANTLVSLKINGLAANKTYKLYFITQNHFEAMSEEVYSSENIKTVFEENAISSFEEVEILEDDRIMDGTSVFEGFEIITAEAANGSNNNKVAALSSSTAKIEIHNTDENGRQLSGFFIKNTNPVVLSLSGSDLPEEEILIPASALWQFINLRASGNISSIEISVQGKEAETSALTSALQEGEYVYIDDFNGEPLPIHIEMPDLAYVESGEAYVFDAEITGGAAPYKYSWKRLDLDQEIQKISSEKTFEYYPNISAIYELKVEDSWKQESTKRINIQVLSGLRIADFENISLGDKTYNRGEPKSGKAVFYSGSFEFEIDNNTSYDAWSGFAVSSSTENKYNSALGLDNQYSCAAGGGALQSAQYAVGYTYSPIKLRVSSDTNGLEIPGCYVANNMWLYYSATTGDISPDDREPFAKGDYFKLKVEGTAKNGEKKSLEFYLADYRSENEADWYIYNEWKYLDLSTLGVVTELSFSVEGSRTNSWGQTLPSYFCIDHLGAEKPEEEEKPEEPEKPEIPGVDYEEGVASFEEFELAENSYWAGELKEGEMSVISSFKSGSYSFENNRSRWEYGELSGESWMGWAYSNDSETDFDNASYETHQYRNKVGTGAEGSKTYAIGFTKASIVARDAKPFEAVGTYITNSAYTYNFMVEDDLNKFEAGDFFKVVATGYLDGDSVSEVEIYLADLRSENTSEHFVNKTWVWADLSELGSVDRIDFTTKSSRFNNYGELTPAYFCIDNFGAEAPVLAAENIAEAAQDIVLYPMPARNNVNIVSKCQNSRVDIYNMSGERVYSARLSSKQASLNIENLPSASYVLRLQDLETGKVYTKKMLKL